MAITYPNPRAPHQQHCFYLVLSCGLSVHIRCKTGLGLYSGLPAFPISRQVDENETVKASEYDKYIEPWVVTTKKYWNNESNFKSVDVPPKNIFTFINAVSIKNHFGHYWNIYIYIYIYFWNESKSIRDAWGKLECHKCRVSTYEGTFFLKWSPRVGLVWA